MRPLEAHGLKSTFGSTELYRPSSDGEPYLVGVQWRGGPTVAELRAIVDPHLPPSVALFPNRSHPYTAYEDVLDVLRSRFGDEILRVVKVLSFRSPDGRQFGLLGAPAKVHALPIQGRLLDVVLDECVEHGLPVPVLTVADIPAWLASPIREIRLVGLRALGQTPEPNAPAARQTVVPPAPPLPPRSHGIR